MSCFISPYQLCHDAADRPDVNLAMVLSAAKQNLWRSIPERDDFVGVAFHGYGIVSGKAKVSKLQKSALVRQPYFVYQEVLRFQISVQYVVAMAKVETFQ